MPADVPQEAHKDASPASGITDRIMDEDSPIVRVRSETVLKPDAHGAHVVPREDPWTLTCAACGRVLKAPFKYSAARGESHCIGGPCWEADG